MLGASSSVGSAIRSELFSKSYSVISTSRLAREHSRDGADGLWVPLDLDSDDSCLLFCENLKSLEFTCAILCVGSMYHNSWPGEKSLESAVSYFSAHVARYLWVIENISYVLHSRSGRILNISSRAAVLGSFDHFYAAAKSAVDAVIRSIPHKSSLPVSALSLAPGLLEGSTMSSLFREADLESHRRRSGYQLWNPKRLAEEVVSILESEKVTWDGSVVEVGPTYL